ncbi:MAG: hypothetical protein B7Z37_23165 [Verrucomicrobia bacterium 12-59-8]|nr:MAG: hypothetical protein B7Z37_23165 [Verrucomicrobia bacterium 12-59-8]
MDAQGAPLAYAELVDRDFIGLNGRHFFTTNATGLDGSDLTLWLGITRLVDPGWRKPPPQPDYQAMIQDLFSEAASCSIQGSYAIGNILPYDVDFTASDAPALLALKEIFLFEKPSYKERTNGDPIHITHPSRLHFTWKDAQGKELGSVSLLNEDRLEFEPTHEVFCTTNDYSSQRNITLLTRAARLALPSYFKKPVPPHYQDLVQGLFAKAAACRMKGYYTDVETDTTHDVDFTAADAPALLALKESFLTEKPDYLGITDSNDAGHIFNSSLHFFWTDAQGKELGHLTLLSGDLLLFESTHDLFTTSSGPGGRVNTTLLTQTAHLALPEIYGNSKPPGNGGGVKKNPGPRLLPWPSSSPPPTFLKPVSAAQITSKTRRTTTPCSPCPAPAVSAPSATCRCVTILRLPPARSEQTAPGEGSSRSLHSPPHPPAPHFPSRRIRMIHLRPGQKQTPALTNQKTAVHGICHAFPPRIFPRRTRVKMHPAPA